MTPRSAALAVLALSLAITGCSSTGDGSDGESTAAVTVNATDTTCAIDPASVPSGPAVFDVTNSGDQVTEVYIYGDAEGAFTSVVAEVENIGPGTSRDMTADLAPGTYEVACKPGQTGDGIRATLTVTGDLPATTASSAAVATREIALSIDTADALGGAEGQSATVGESIEFVVSNEGAAERIFEVKRPDGSVAGETEIAPGATGELTIDASVAGDWVLIVEGGDSETETAFPVS